MTTDSQPLDEKFSIADLDGRPTLYFIKWAQQREIDISDTATTAESAAETAKWGGITGNLTDQTDLQAILSHALIWQPWGPTAPTYWNVPIEDGLIFTATDGSFIEFESSGVNPRAIWVAADDGFSVYWGIGAAKPSGRYTIEGDQAFEFQAPPYVIDDAIWYEGNLSFGTGLTYTAGVLSAANDGSVGVLPVVDGSIPPVFLQNPDGSLIYAPV